MGRKSRGREQQRRDFPVSGGKASLPSEDANAATRFPDFRSPATLAATAVLLLVLATVWAVPRTAGDTFLALSGGRDVFQGKLGKPDNWSFTTSGRVWLNQNWGFDAIAYAADKMAGEGGLLALKAAFLLAIAGSMAAASRTRGARWPEALLLVAAVLAGARWHFELRANLVSYLMASVLILIIYWSVVRPHLIWIAVPVMAAWANLHGSFMLGFGLLGLWVAANGLPCLLRSGLSQAIRRVWLTGTVLALSIALAIILSPFGTTNLTEPFTIARAAEWRTISEWQPVVLTSTRGPSTVWELLLLLILIFAAAGWRWLTQRGAHERREAGQPEPVELLLFDGGLFSVMTALAFSANRFVPLALIVLAPVAATLVGPLLRLRQSWIPTVLSALALATLMLPFVMLVKARYGPANPRYTNETWFQRMVGADRMPYGAADFLNDNAVGGRVFNEWRWEGFLHWRCPQLQVFLGGRAQQIYSIDALHAYHEVLSSQRPADLLARRDVHLVVVPAESEYLALAGKLAFGNGAHWAVVFYDNHAVVLSDLSAPPTRALAEGVTTGRAHFRTKSLTELSRALCRVSSAFGTAGPRTVADLASANQAFPTSGGPWFLLFASEVRQIPPQLLVRSLEAEDELLREESERTAGRLARLQARVSISEILAHLYQLAGRMPQAREWANTRDDLRSQLQSLLADS